MQLSIVIPTFNERENVRTIVQRIGEVLARNEVSDYEIWFVDDSVDDTPDVLQSLAESDSRVRYKHRTKERGLGTAVVEGFSRCVGQHIVVMDADLQHPPELLPVILNRLREGTDVVVPSRFVEGGSDGGLNAFRKLVSWTARGIGRLAIRRLRYVSDCTGGYFGLNRRVIEGAELRPIGWKILIEVLVRGRYESVHEIPYQFVARDAGESKMDLREQWNYIRHILKLVWSSPEDRRFYLFCLIGVLGTVVNIFAMSVLIYGLHVRGITSSIIASIIAMAHNFLWNDRVTWKGHAHRVPWRRALQVPLFMLISSVSILVTALFVQIALWLHVNELFGQVVGIVIATAWSFLANNRWTWTSSRDDAPQRSRIRVTHEEPQRP